MLSMTILAEDFRQTDESREEWPFVPLTSLSDVFEDSGLAICYPKDVYSTPLFECLDWDDDNNLVGAFYFMGDGSVIYIRAVGAVVDCPWEYAGVPQDLGQELERTYFFEGEEPLTINEPRALVAANGYQHEILDARGEKVVVLANWIAIRWTVRKDAYHFTLV